MANEERTAVLVVRLWREADGGNDGIRGRVSMTANAAQPASSSETVVASGDEVLGLVRAWLEAFDSG